MPTILVTSCSSGFGLEITRVFLDRDWAVVGTMRQPRQDALPPSDRLRVLALDVTRAPRTARPVAVAESGRAACAL